MKALGYDEEIFRGITKVTLVVQKTIFCSITKVTLVVLETNVRNSLSDVILPLAFNNGTWHNVPGTSIDGSLAKLSNLGHALVQN